MNYFFCNHDLIETSTALHKGALRLGYDYGEDRTEPENQNLRKDLIGNIAKTNWPVVLDCNQSLLIGDKNEHCFIQMGSRVPWEKKL